MRTEDGLKWTKQDRIQIPILIKLEAKQQLKEKSLEQKKTTNTNVVLHEKSGFKQHNYICTVTCISYNRKVSASHRRNHTASCIQTWNFRPTSTVPCTVEAAHTLDNRISFARQCSLYTLYYYYRRHYRNKLELEKPSTTIISPEPPYPKLNYAPSSSSFFPLSVSLPIARCSYREHIFAAMALTAV